MNYELQTASSVLTIGRRPLLMGIVNVTPDSFSDGGQFLSANAAVAHGLQLVEDGADILDIGGESTRPGAAPVSLKEELQRVLLVIEQLALRVSVPLSIDTSKAEVARQAVAAGASIINDVTALTGDPTMPAVAKAAGAGIVLMHMQGTPQTMQLNPQYTDVVAEVRDYLQQRLVELASVGIEPQRLAVDPGIGFGKSLQHNLDLLSGLPALKSLGRPICLGVSRKGFINKVLGQPGKAEQGVAGTLGVLLHSLAQGTVQIARVHDVAAARAAITMFLAVSEASQKR